jgi:hypothetical protein
MEEGAVKQEGQPIISDLFPVGAKSALAAFRDLSLQENPDGAEAAATQEMNILSETNRDVLDYDLGILLQIPREAGDQLFGGVLVCHRALREEAKARGGILPTFTDEFIQEFHNKGVEALRARIANEQISDHQAASELTKLHLVEFQNMEPEFSKIVREKLGVHPDWRPEEDPRYLGIIHMHFLF